MGIVLEPAEWWLLLLAIAGVGLVITRKRICFWIAVGLFPACVVAAMGTDIVTQISSCIVTYMLCGAMLTGPRADDDIDGENDPADNAAQQAQAGSAAIFPAENARPNGCDAPSEWTVVAKGSKPFAASSAVKSCAQRYAESNAWMHAPGIDEE